MPNLTNADPNRWKLEAEFEYRGLDCAVVHVRTGVAGPVSEWRCGYAKGVLLGDQESIERVIWVSGGLTYFEMDTDTGLTEIGFDTGHSFDNDMTKDLASAVNNIYQMVDLLHEHNLVATKNTLMETTIYHRAGALIRRPLLEGMIHWTASRGIKFEYSEGKGLLDSVFVFKLSNINGEQYRQLLRIMKEFGDD